MSKHISKKSISNRGPLAAPPHLSSPRAAGHTRRALAVMAALLAGFAPGCAPPEPPEEPALPEEALAGGGFTIFSKGRDAFSLPGRTVTKERRRDFFVGNAFFNQNWVTAPASTTARDGLGPVFNGTACSSCHFKDGRSGPPADGIEPLSNVLVRLSVPGEDARGGPLGDSVYGGQLQTESIAGVDAEGVATIVWHEDVHGTYDDGTAYTLRRPELQITDLSFGPLNPEMLTSVRVAPHMIGLGLLEAVDEADWLAFEDADDADGDGISGRANTVYDVVSKTDRMGRFGWKANKPNLLHQAAGAFAGDIGITSDYFPAENCGENQMDCQAAFVSDEPDVSAHILKRVTQYTQLLAPPAVRDHDDPRVTKGRELMETVGCTACHIPRWETADTHDEEALRGHVIYPFTDLLLHDMGPALADGRPDFDADGSEWRTPPLWGLGMVPAVNDHQTLLHDGRARGFAEAILWHGGEAEASRDAFKALDKDDREALLFFLESI